MKYLLVVCMFLTMSCESQDRPFRWPAGLDLQGHRGCRGLMPENTIPAMLKALDLGVPTLELDVVISRDGQVLLSHEPFFHHDISTRPDGSTITAAEEKSFNLFKMDYSGIRTWDVGLKPHPRFPKQQKIKVHKPLLSEVFQAVADYCRQRGKSMPHFNIETKSQPSTDGEFHPAPAEFVNKVLAVIDQFNLRDRVIIQSFDPRTLRYLHQVAPFMTTAWLVESLPVGGIAESIQELGFQPSIFSPAYFLVTPVIVDWCHQRNIRVIPWTVNDVPAARSLLEKKVDGIITDYPDLFTSGR